MRKFSPKQWRVSLTRNKCDWWDKVLAGAKSLFNFRFHFIHPTPVTTAISNSRLLTFLREKRPDASLASAGHLFYLGLCL